MLIYTVKLTLKVCIGIQNYHKSLKKIDELNCPFFMHVRLNKDTKCTSMRINIQDKKKQFKTQKIHLSKGDKNE